jgi:hypothetical protein
VTDQFAVSGLTALVVLVSGILFVIDTLLRRRDIAGRIWSVAFVAAILTTLLYLVWAWDPETVWAVAGGNGMFVLGTGAMWAGCVQFNGGRAVRSGAIAGTAALLTALAVVIEWEFGARDWAGALVMFAGLACFAGLAAWECFRRDLGRIRTALPLGIVFLVQSVYYLVRTVVFVAEGPDSPLFQEWFSTLSASILTIVLTITAVVSISVLRASRVPLLGTSDPGAETGLLTASMFASELARAAERAARRGDLLAVTVARLEGLDDIAAGFGIDVADAQRATWRAATRDGAPTVAIVGEIDAGSMGIVSVVAAPADARAQGLELYRTLFGAMSQVHGGVLPAIGVGIALSDIAGHDATALTRVAVATAERAASGQASAVLLAETV